MGTSKGYDAPTTPQWKAVKSLVTRSARDGRPDSQLAQRILGDFVRAAGGRREYAQGRGSLGRTQSAQRVASSLGRFLRQVASAGLPEALRELGLERLADRPVGEILDALVDVLGGPAETLDDIDARNALSDLRDELLAPAESLDDLEDILAAETDGEGFLDLFVRYYGLFLYHQFCRVFYERLVERVGARQADTYLHGIRDFLNSALRDHHIARDLRNVDWDGEEGRQLANELLEKALFVYGGE